MNNVQKILDDCFSGKNLSFNETYTLLFQLQEAAQNQPEAATALLSAFEQIFDYGNCSDLLPTMRRTYIAINKNLSEDKIWDSLNFINHKNMKLFLDISGDVTANHPQLAKQMFDEVVNLFSYNKNTNARYGNALLNVVSQSSVEDGKELLTKMFNFQPDLKSMIEDSFGKLAVKRPEFIPQIHEYLQNFQPTSADELTALFNNIAALVPADEQHRASYLYLIKKYITVPEMDSVSIVSAYKALAALRGAGYDIQAVDNVFYKGLASEVNTKATRKMVYRYTEHLEKLYSMVTIGKRVEKNEKNPEGWKTTDSISPTETCILFLGGDGTRTEKGANGYLKSIEKLLDKNELKDSVGMYAIVYDFGDFEDRDFVFNCNQARTKMMKDYHHSVNLKTVSLSPDTINPRYIKQLFDKVILKRICDDDGKKLSAEEACRRIRKLNVVAHCHGGYTFLKLEEMMQDKMKELGYTPDEQEKIQKQLLCVAHAPYCPLGVSKSTLISFFSAEDDEVNHHNKFQYEIQQLVDNDAVKFSYFPKEQGELFVVPHMSLNFEFDEHCFMGYDTNLKGLSEDGKNLLVLSGNAIIGGVCSSLENTPLPDIKTLVCRGDVSTEKLFEKIKQNGQEMWQTMIMNAYHRKSGNQYSS